MTKVMDAALKHSQKQVESFLAGIKKAQKLSAQASLDHYDEIWRLGNVRLLDCGKGTGKALNLPILLVPSLVNRAQVFDLMPQRSFVRFLKSQGLHPYILDWGEPGQQEQLYEIENYSFGCLEPALNKILEASGKKPHLLAYCMGGTLSLPFVQKHQKNLQGLTLMATPWDFHQSSFSKQVQQFGPILNPWLEKMPALPPEMVQFMFFLQKPEWGMNKYMGLAEKTENAEKDALFAAVETWINNGVALAKQVAKTCFNDWYTDNKPMQGLWKLAEQTVTPEAIKLPTMVMSAIKDHLVPPASSKPLADAIPDAQWFEANTGHLGLMVSSRAQKEVWEPWLKWLKNQE